MDLGIYIFKQAPPLKWVQTFGDTFSEADLRFVMTLWSTLLAVTILSRAVVQKCF